MDSATSFHFSRRVAWALLLVSGIGLYFQTLSASFVWDDHGLIVENPYLAPGQWLELWTHDFWMASARSGTSGFYRPMVATSYYFDRLLWGTSPFGFHLTNLLLHLANGLLAFSLLLRLTRRAEVALFAALLFLVHPLQAEAVAQITNRTDLLAAFFALSTLVVLEVTAGHRRLLAWGGAVTAALLTAAAGLSKESAVALLPICALMIWLFPGDRSTPASRIRPVLALTVGLVIMGMLRSQVLGSLAGNTALVGQAISSGAFLYTPLGELLYLKKLLFPVGLSPRYPAPPLEPVAGVGAFILWTGLFLLAWRRRKERPEFLFGLGWFFIGMLPTTMLLTQGMRRSDLFTYLPGLGIHLTVAALIPVSRPLPARVLVLTSSLLVALAVGTSVRLPVWHDDVSLWEDTVRKQPEDALAWMNFGNALLVVERDEEARNALENALRLSHAEEPALELPDRTVAGLAYYNLGNLYRRGNDLERAREMFQRAIAAQPNFLSPRMNLVIVLLKQKQLDAAEVEARELLALEPQDFRVLNLLGVIVAQKGNSEAAGRLFTEALAIDPGFLEAQRNLERIERQRLAAQGSP